MQFNQSLRLSRFVGPRDGRRIPGRVAQELLVSDLGPVLDLSPGGMRVLATRPHVGKLDVRIRAGDVSLTLRSNVAWSRRLGFRRHELGLAFIDVDENAAGILATIAADHRARQVI